MIAAAGYRPAKVAPAASAKLIAGARASARGTEFRGHFPSVLMREGFIIQPE
jgi:hypothetical protein